NIFGLFFGLLTLITSADIWLSGQYAQLDTSITFFLTLSLFSLLYYTQKKKAFLLNIAGISWSLAVLSKGQPAIIIIFPLIYLFLAKRLSLKEILRFILAAGVILIPWIILLEIYFGFFKVISIFTKFAASSSLIEYIHIKAPIFWYARWWFDTFQPGFVLFAAFLIKDLRLKNFDYKKLTLLTYIIPSFILFSLSENKIWWYVLPLVPAVAFYIYISVSDYLERKKFGSINISIITILIALPIFFQGTNKIVMAYGIGILAVSYIILMILNFKFLSKVSEFILISSFLVSLYFFNSHFSKIVPYHYNTKPVAQYFTSLPGRKCLWIYDMPVETALFYSNVGEILSLTKTVQLLPRCMNYLITPSIIEDQDLTYFDDTRMLNLKDRNVIFQKGSMKLVNLEPE
ncbi:MAG: Uncharacterized protein G01um101493_152, partial [Microgenomates group bacterium Gr01-1014_93]